MLKRLATAEFPCPSSFAADRCASCQLRAAESRVHPRLKASKRSAPTSKRLPRLGDLRTPGRGVRLLAERAVKRQRNVVVFGKASALEQRDRAFRIAKA